MIRVFVSPFALERRAAAAEFFRSRPAGTEVLLIGATRGAADDLARRRALEVPATWGLERASLRELAARLALTEFGPQGVALATPFGREAVAARSLFAALQSGALDYFNAAARHPGWARALARTLAELGGAGVRPEALAALEGSGRELAKVLELYQAQLGRASLADGAALFRAATRALSGRRGEGASGEPAPSDLGQRPTVLLDLAIDSAVERDFIAALLERSPAALATVPAGDQRSLEAWTSLAGVVLERPVSPGGSSCARLAQSLFSEASPGFPPDDDTVRFFSAPGESRESVEIARRVLEEARAGTPFDQMAILLRDPATYSDRVVAALGRAGIPAFFAPGLRRPDPMGRAFLAILAWAAEDLSARRFAEYLSLDQMPAFAEGATPWRWERWLVGAAVVGGRDRWPRRLNGLEAEWRGRLVTLAERQPESPEVGRLERDLTALGHLERFVLPLVETLGGFPTRAVWASWLSELQALAPRVLRRPERVLAVLAELRPLSETGPVSLDDVRDALRPHLASVEEEPPGNPYGRVFVGTLEQTRGRSFEVVFVPGLAEGIFPRAIAEDPLLADSLRRRVSPADQPGHPSPGLATQPDRLARERLLLRLAAGAATRRVYFSYPRLEIARSRARVASFYALDVKRALTGRLPGVQELERDAALASRAGLAWPAPAEPDLAIDALEHDLAVLGGLLGPDGAGRSTGRARYLLQLHAPLARSLRARWARWSRAWSFYDGLCEPGEGARQALAAHRLTARPYSVSALQKFAVCPYQFFLSSIHRLAPREESLPLEQMEARTRGHFFHRAQAEFGRNLQTRGRWSVSASNLGEAFQILDQILGGEDGEAGIAVEYRERLAPAIRRVWDGEVGAIRTDLRAWLRWLAQHPAESEWRPVYFELGIGFSPGEGRDPRSRPDPVTLEGGYRLHGIVDSIERRSGEGRRAELRVTDYKTGQDRTREGMVIGGGESLQPVLYGLAVEAALGEPVVESRFFFATAAGGFTERNVKLDEGGRRAGLAALGTIDRAVEQGFLPPAPRPQACSWCDFRIVCGPHEEVRVTRKDPARLADLLHLRNLP